MRYKFQSSSYPLKVDWKYSRLDTLKYMIKENVKVHMVDNTIVFRKCVCEILYSSFGDLYFH